MHVSRVGFDLFVKSRADSEMNLLKSHARFRYSRAFPPIRNFGRKPLRVCRDGTELTRFSN